MPTLPFSRLLRPLFCRRKRARQLVCDWTGDSEMLYPFGPGKRLLNRQLDREDLCIDRACYPGRHMKRVNYLGG